MRWARTRDLPVHRLPGGAKSTVFALASELDHWARSQTDLDEDTPTEGQPPDPSSPTPQRVPLWAIAGMLLLGLSTGALLIVRPAATAETQMSLPADADVAALYLRARDLWGERRPASLRNAIALFEQVTARAPDYAPAWSGLADAYLLAREFGGMADKQAFEAARTAADRALALDDRLAGAYRARGFITYWWEKDPRRAGLDFRRALTLAPNDAQTYFWYGNILADNGESALALRALNRARMIEPGSVAIQSDLAYAEWFAGHDQRARETLERLAATYPDFPGAHDCLTDLALVRGDYAGFMRSFTAYARTSDNADLLAFADELAPLAASDPKAMIARLVARDMAEIASGARRTHSRPVFFASMARDRPAVVTMLRRADERGETWGEAGLRRRVADVWRNDAEIQTLLTRREPPSVV